MQTGRILALDLGKRRIGLAISDELGIKLSPRVFGAAEAAAVRGWS